MMCREAVEATTDASENALSPWRRLMYALHMVICPACKTHRHQVDTTRATLEALERPEPSADSRRRAAEAFERAKGKL